jgi:hypothetical protein
LLWFIIRVKRELKRVYRNGCRYNERLNAETGGSNDRLMAEHGREELFLKEKKCGNSD